MITLAVVLFLVGIFFFRDILWKIAAVLLVVGIVLVIMHGGFGVYAY